MFVGVVMASRKLEIKIWSLELEIQEPACIGEEVGGRRRMECSTYLRSQSAGERAASKEEEVWTEG